MQMKHCNSPVASALAATPLFAGIPEPACASVMAELGACIREYEAGEVVTHECAPASDVLCVLSGRIRVSCCKAADDARHLVRLLEPGDVYGAAFPVLEMAESPAMLVAAERTRVLALKVAAARRIVRSGACPRLVANLYAVAARQGFDAWRKLAIMSHYEIADRVLAYLKWRDEKGDGKRMRLSELAAYLGVNRTSLYRAIGKLTKNDTTRALVRAHVKLQTRGT